MESEVITRRRHYGANSSESRGSRRVTIFLLMLFLSIVIGFLTTAAVLNSAIADSMEAFSIILVNSARLNCRFCIFAEVSPRT
jgi:hypothetical protein